MTREEIEATYGKLLSKHWACTTTGTHKLCSKCKQWLPHNNFSVCEQAKLSKRRATCKKCVKDAYSRASTFRKHGIEKSDFLKMANEQGFKCSICGSISSGNKRTEHLCIDHDHETGTIRGLLCMQCNTGLGNFKDSPELLLKAVEYLKQ